jgi:hypothetical protein
MTRPRHQTPGVLLAGCALIAAVTGCAAAHLVPAGGRHQVQVLAAIRAVARF